MLPTLGFFARPLLNPGGLSEPAFSLVKTAPLLVLQDLGSPWDHWNEEGRKELAALRVAEGANGLGLER